MADRIALLQGRQALCRWEPRTIFIAGRPICFTAAFFSEINEFFERRSWRSCVKTPLGKTHEVSGNAEGRDVPVCGRGPSFGRYRAAKRAVKYRLASCPGAFLGVVELLELAVPWHRAAGSFTHSCGRSGAGLAKMSTVTVNSQDIFVFVKRL